MKKNDNFIFLYWDDVPSCSCAGEHCVCGLTYNYPEDANPGT
jgi:hypothetical protein